MSKQINMQLPLMIGLGFVVILALLIYWRIITDATPIANNMRVVKLVHLTSHKENSSVVYPGKIEANKHARLFFRVSGPIIERSLVLGQIVKENEVLMRIDPRDYQHEVDMLSGDLASLEARKELADTQFKRKKNMMSSNAISVTEFDMADTDIKTATAQYNKTIAALSKAKDMLNDTELKAPFAGTISEINIELHEFAAAGRQVLVLNDIETLKVRIQIPGKDIREIADKQQNFVGQTFKVRVPGKTELFDAVATELSLAAGASEAYEAVLEMKRPQNVSVLPGMSAEVIFDKNLNVTDMILPYSAICNRDGQSYIWVYDPATKTVQRREAKALHTVGDNSVAIEGEVKTGDYVVAAGGDWLTDGAMVSVLNAGVLNGNN